jgi:hypothetical protein
MLTLKQILAVGRMMEQTGGRPNVSLDRHDNPDHRGSNYTPAYVPTKPGAKSVRIELDYECGSDGDVRIVQR